MVTTGIVGSSMPIATGIGWAAKLQGKGQVSIAYFGDGAANIGAFHESLNLAALWKLPVLFVCQNNLYAEHTSFANSSLVERISDRAASYGMPGVTVNGNDAAAMYGAAKVAVDRARAGEGPTLIEALTFRFIVSLPPFLRPESGGEAARGFLTTDQRAVAAGNAVKVGGELHPRPAIDLAGIIGDLLEPALVEIGHRFGRAHDVGLLQLRR